MPQPALLVLADGTSFAGTAIGYSDTVTGEVVFNTSMSGYQEILTDPSYARQIITFTYPPIGHVGCNEHHTEAPRSWAAGIVIRDLSLAMSNWRSEQSLDDFLRQQKITGIADIDTRALTHHLRETGSQNGCITPYVDQVQQAQQMAEKCESLIGQNLAQQVTTPQQYSWQQGSIAAGHLPSSSSTSQSAHVVVYDFGVKRSMLRLLVDRSCRVTVVPANTPASDVLALQPDGIVLSNGPGDPAACDTAIANIKQLLTHKIPLLAICLGCQLVTLALGGGTQKMKFGHHGANHPIIDLTTRQVFITSQNHGFMVDEAQLSSEWVITHRSLFDNTIQGLRHHQWPILAFQGHPEAHPGPHDTLSIWDDFIDLITTANP
ncbi:MAG: glutamine-hydrolyzing carbamoyl-phosphate synthase small subunit [Legionellales bacterium]|nr:glutamine-hydrolyzing carbamoyl-phosphate synthase small subunit [Legionellales bacterium]